MRELIIIESQNERNIEYLEDGILKEHYKEQEDKKRLEGNIYAGKVIDVLPGMQAAFVNIGEGKNTFLHIRDVLPKKSNVTGNKEEDLEKYKIKDYIKQNQMVLIQVKKDETQIKGARVSTNIQMPGRFVVILPENDFITISQKIENEEEKQRLVDIIKEEIGDKKLGVIIRTAAEGKSKEAIINDIKNTLKKLEYIIKESKEEKNVPKVILKNDTILEKILLDLADNKLDKILVSSKKVKNEVENILKQIQVENDIVIELQGKELENKYDLQKQIEKIENRKIWLKCGGFITIDRTEALTAIDVNSRKIYWKRKFRINSCKGKQRSKYRNRKTIKIKRYWRNNYYRLY